MKKFLALVLAVVCAFSLFSCGNDSVKAFTKAMENTEPAVVKLNITVSMTDGDLEASYVTTYNEDGSFTVDYSYENFATSSEGGAEDAVVVKTGKVTCDKDGKYSDGGAISGQVESLSGSKLSLKSKKMSAKVSDDGNVLTATVSAKNTKTVFGVEFAGDVSLVITKAQDKIVSYTMTYATDDCDVVVTCEYK